MSENVLGNESNMAKIEEAMRLQQKVRLGGEFTHKEELDFTANSGNRYVGAVAFKRATALDLMKIGGMKSEFLRLGGAKDPMLVDQGVRVLAHIMATLSVVVTERPAWLKDVTEVVDVDVLYHVFDKYEDWTDSFRKGISSESESDHKASERA